MPIKRRQLDNLVETILREELCKGQVPNSRQFLLRLNRALTEHKLGTPTTKAYRVQGNSSINVDKHNEFINTTRDDLEVLYSELIQSVDATLKNFDYFEVEKKKLEYQIEKMRAELVNVLLVSDKSNQYIHTIYDTFSDINLVDLSKTTAEVDIANNQVVLSQSGSQKMNLTSAKASFSFNKGEWVTVSEMGSLENIFSDKANDIWNITASTYTEQIFVGELIIELSERIQTNKLTVSLHSPRITEIDVLYSPDLLNWFPIPNSKHESLTSEQTYLFHDINIAALKLILTKQTADAIRYEDEKAIYDSVFGVKNVSVYKAAFANSGALQSVIHEIESSKITVDKVSLSVDNEVPAGTEIKYYLAFPDGDNQPAWVPISPLEDKQPKHPQVITLGNITNTKATLKFPTLDQSVPAERELKQHNVNGIKFYVLPEINSADGLIDRNITSALLYRGKNAWKVEQYTYNREEGYIPTLADWVNIPSQATNNTLSFQNINTSSNSLMYGNSSNSYSANTKYTVAILMDSAKNITLRPVGNVGLSIYCNGQNYYSSQPNIASDISIKLKAGWNILQVLIYQHKDIISSLNIGANLLAHVNRVYAESTPLKQVSLFNLQYNVLSSDYDSFTVEKIGNKSRIVLNHYYPGLSYELAYNYTVQNNDKIIFKAEMSRLPDMLVSPKLNSYQIRFI